MYKGKKISIVLPEFNEEKNIGRAISDFWKLKIVDEIIVIDNNSKDRTSESALRNKAKVIKEHKQGYGFALQRGLREAKGDYVVLCEPDGTFVAADLLKLLSKMGDYDIVSGIRTNKKFISRNANMGEFLRLGNIFVAKITQFLYSPTTNLSDCGCTFKVIKKISC
ncbi:MAG: glycosyltransferase family 2 protein [Candidatus Levybacteria bacterium]|nr:glycosyltransferase family 2 protein [Candidatus Levybacteria bacterium]